MGGMMGGSGGMGRGVGMGGPSGVGGNDAITSILDGMSQNQLYEIMWKMKTLIQQNPEQARKILTINPQLAYALLQAQVILGMVEPTIVQQLVQNQIAQQTQQQVVQGFGGNVPFTPQGGLPPPAAQPSQPLPPQSRGPPGPMGQGQQPFQPSQPFLQQGGVNVSLGVQFPTPSQQQQMGPPAGGFGTNSASNQQFQNFRGGLPAQQQPPQMVGLGPQQQMVGLGPPQTQMMGLGSQSQMMGLGSPNMPPIMGSLMHNPQQQLASDEHHTLLQQVLNLTPQEIATLPHNTLRQQVQQLQQQHRGAALLDFSIPFN